jgi:hypothetical protein
MTPHAKTPRKNGTPMPSGYRNKNTHVRYAQVQDPHDPSGTTRVKTEKGPSWFEIKTENLELVPLDGEDLAEMSTEVAHDGDDNLTPSVGVMVAPEAYSTFAHEPKTVEMIAQRRHNADPQEDDYLALARSMPFNLGRALECMWLSVHGHEYEAKAMLREARFHLADEMQRVS